MLQSAVRLCPESEALGQLRRGDFTSWFETLGARWRIDLNARALPGQPDVFIPSVRLVLFADGCFYHGCPQHGHQPKSNRKYWLPKLARNQKRDLANRRALRAMGYRVLAFWEHELRGRELEKTREKIIRRIGELAKDKRRGTAKCG